jgi:hypothetical protein
MVPLRPRPPATYSFSVSAVLVAGTTARALCCLLAQSVWFSLPIYIYIRPHIQLYSWHSPPHCLSRPKVPLATSYGHLDTLRQGVASTRKKLPVSTLTAVSDVDLSSSRHSLRLAPLLPLADWSRGKPVHHGQPRI